MPTSPSAVGRTSSCPITLAIHSGLTSNGTVLEQGTQKYGVEARFTDAAGKSWTLFDKSAIFHFLLELRL